MIGKSGNDIRFADEILPKGQDDIPAASGDEIRPSVGLGILSIFAENRYSSSCAALLRREFCRQISPWTGLREFPLCGENFAWRRENFCWSRENFAGGAREIEITS